MTPGTEDETSAPRGRLWQIAPWFLSCAVVVVVSLFLGPGFARLRPGSDAEEARGRSPFALPAQRAETADRASSSASRPMPWNVLEPDPAADAAPTTGGLPDWSEVAPPPSASGARSDSSVDCIIEPWEVVDIGSAVRGLIEHVHVERSELVEEGQVLVELESDVERAAVAIARTRAHMEGEVRARETSLSLGTRRQARARELFKQEALSRDLFEEVDTEAKLARLELKQAREKQQLAVLQLGQALEDLDRRTIRSPIAGVVIERLMSPGELVDEETILRIAKVDPLRVEVILPSARFGSVQPGMRAAVVPEFPGDEVHVATVSIVDRVIDAASGTFGVRLELPNAKHEIPGGLHCQVRFLNE